MVNKSYELPNKQKNSSITGSCAYLIPVIYNICQIRLSCPYKLSANFIGYEYLMLYNALLRIPIPVLNIVNGTLTRNFRQLRQSSLQYDASRRKNLTPSFINFSYLFFNPIALSHPSVLFINSDLCAKKHVSFGGRCFVAIPLVVHHIQLRILVSNIDKVGKKYPYTFLCNPFFVVHGFQLANFFTDRAFVFK